MLEKKSTKRRTHLEMMKAIPGIQQAFMLVMKAAKRASRKEDGEIDKEKYNELKLKLTKKVSELWELSPMMEQYLIQRWVEGKVKVEVKPIPGERTGLIRYLFRDKTKDTGQILELEVLLAEEEQDFPELKDINSKLEDIETRLITPGRMRRKHIYLDVTAIDYRTLRDAYKAISKCRKLLGIETFDVRRGAPESIDYTRALMCARGEERGLSKKEIAEKLGFKIYRQDIPSGTYPLFHKYLRVGRWILHRLSKLEEYIQGLTGIDPDTL